MAAIHWFRKGLRLHDNPALLAACSSPTKVIYPVYILDPRCKDRVSLIRLRFLLQALADLQLQLKKMGSRLYVVRGIPEEQLPRLFKIWSIKLITFETDTEPFAVQRDGVVTKAAADAGVEVRTFATHTLFPPEAYFKLCGGVEKFPTASYGSFLKLFNQLGPLPRILSAPVSLPATVAATKIPDDSFEGGFEVPSLAELGYPEANEIPILYPGGETAGLDRMDLHTCEKMTSWVAGFEKPNTAPNALKPSTTVLSPYLKFGCLSPRLFWHRIAECYTRSKKTPTAPPVSLHGQLLWREWFTMCSFVTLNFDKMVGNRLCKQIDWDINPNLVLAWEEGRTGYPFIDAIMNQLRQEGWIHHLARHAVACFLTRGDLYQSWEVGARVFDKHLIDGDWALNNANWMWLSCSSFFYQYFRVYSPIAFGKKTDPSGDYIRLYVPALANMPAKYIYEPWSAPAEVQLKAGCVVGVNYPHRICDHAIVSKQNMNRLKGAYARNGKGSASPGDGNGRSADVVGDSSTTFVKPLRGSLKRKELAD